MWAEPEAPQAPGQDLPGNCSKSIGPHPASAGPVAASCPDPDPADSCCPVQHPMPLICTLELGRGVGHNQVSITEAAIPTTVDFRVKIPSAVCPVHPVRLVDLPKLPKTWAIPSVLTQVGMALSGLLRKDHLIVFTSISSQVVGGIRLSQRGWQLLILSASTGAVTVVRGLWQLLIVSTNIQTCIVGGLTLAGDLAQLCIQICWPWWQSGWHFFLPIGLLP